MDDTNLLTILSGDCRDVLPTVAGGSVHCCVTSPPYWGLRSYLPQGHVLKGREIGLEKSPGEFVETMVAVFREVRRVLREDGTLWLNLGDCYASNLSGKPQTGLKALSDKYSPRKSGPRQNHRHADQPMQEGRGRVEGLKEKDLVGMPWRVAFALQADGWWLRQCIIWHKPNPMPESVRDRCTNAHEYIFLMSKAPRYYFDAEAIRNPASEALLKQVSEGYNGTDTKSFLEAGAQSASGTKGRIIEGMRKRVDKQRGHGRRHDGFNDRWDAMTKEEQQACGSNKRSVWTVATAPYKEAHFATFPPDLVKPCVLAGCPAGGVVLDPFGGSGTTAQVALELGRRAMLVELNPEYRELCRRRLDGVTPGLGL